MEKKYDQQKTIDQIKKIKSLKLTRAGKLTLSQYNHSALLQAENALQSASRTINNTFEYFQSTCRKIAMDQKLQGDTSLLEKAFRNNIVKGNEPMINDHSIKDSYADSYQRHTSADVQHRCNVYKLRPAESLLDLTREKQGYVEKLNQPSPVKGFLEEPYFQMIRNQIACITKKIDMLLANGDQP